MPIHYYIDEKGTPRSAKTHSKLSLKASGKEYVLIHESNAAPKRSRKNCSHRDKKLIKAAKEVLRAHNASTGSSNLKAMYNAEVGTGAAHAEWIYEHGSGWHLKKPKRSKKNMQ